jgi:hypothetical protein
MLLTDIRLLTNLQIIAESKETNMMKIRGIFQRADEVNNNKRIYPKALMEEHVKEMQPAIRENRLLGELDHPAYDVVKLSNASHKITKLEMQGNDVIGEAVILGTPAGKVAQELIKGGVAIGISSRGTGTLAEGKGGHSTVKEYHGITYDLVADPSTRGAFPSLTESKVADQRKYILDIMNKVYGEKVLVRMIENSLSKTDEGVSTGGEPYKTGVRIGKATPNKKKTNGDVGVQINRIATKISNRAGGKSGFFKGKSFRKGIGDGHASKREEALPMDNLKSKIEEIAQSLKTIKLARAKRMALAKKGFGDKTSTLQKAKNDANPEYQAKMQANRAPMLKAALDKKKDSTPEKTEESIKKEEKSYLIMEIFKKFGFKNRYGIAADVKRDPTAPPKKQKKAQKILSKLADRNVKTGFKPKKDDQLGYS